ncbi:MAG: DUF1501 domain-containing protein, partial [SAR324 cluster bacterium]|nr:DUF1501 domain-containing protein [SAR324 cluster bacterium]
VTRRDLLHIGGLAAFGLGLTDVFAMRRASGGESAAPGIKARSCILIWLDGGPTHYETFDPKPDAPKEVRGPMASIPTNLSGVRLGECLENTAAIMDKLAIEATEEYAQSGYPVGAEAILLVEFDGPESEVEYLLGKTGEVLRKAGATEIRVSSSEEERLKLWAGRKAAFPAMGRISPDYYCMDGTIPRAALPRVLGEIRRLSDKYGLRVANVFHAGDGNLHPLVLYDSNQPGELEKAEEMGTEILKLCVDVGGVLTGEHGVGVEKRDLMSYQFGENDLDAMQRVKCSFDADSLLNPGKMFPTLHRCAELGKMHVHGGKLLFPDIERF